MILDKLLMFSEAQAVTATAASTDVIDLAPVDGTRRDIGVGYPLEFWLSLTPRLPLLAPPPSTCSCRPARITAPGRPFMTAAPGSGSA